MKSVSRLLLEIGNPHRVSEDLVEWACPVSVTPLYGKLADMHGGDSLQALCMAIPLALDLLDGFKEEGGRLEFNDGD